MKKAIIIFSGGPDSTAAAQWATLQGYSVELLTFKFAKGIEQDAEINSARKVSTYLSLPHIILNFSSLMDHFSPQSRVLMHTGVPKSKDDKTKPHLLTFGSGMVLSTAATYALYYNTNTIIWGATKDDGYLNKDYTQNFASSLAKLINEVTNIEFNIIVPFSEQHKYQILSIYQDKEKLFAETFSCLFPIEEKHCGICKACIARRTAAELADLKDSTYYVNKTFVNPLTEEKIKNPALLSDLDFEKLILADSKGIIPSASEFNSH